MALVEFEMIEPVLTPPVSKSDAERALILADIMGVSSPVLGIGEAALPKDVKIVRDGLWALRHQKAMINCHDGGAPFRFLVTQAALIPGTKIDFMGTERLAQRPHDALINSLITSLSPLGVRIEYTPGQWPVTIETPETSIQPTSFSVKGSESSQFASSLLLGAARLVARSHRAITVNLEGKIASAGYLEMTCRWLELCGFNLENSSAGITVTHFHEPRGFPAVPGDWSALTYLLPIAWKTGSLVEHVVLQADHPDKRIIEQLRTIGLELRFVAKNVAAVDGELRGGLKFDAGLAPDSVPALVAIACALSVPSTISNTSILRVKESDRVEGVRSLAHAVGASTELSGDVLKVTPSTTRRNFAFDPRGDHRLAMAAVTAAILLEVKVSLTDRECVQKSFPAFFSEVAKSGRPALADSKQLLS